MQSEPRAVSDLSRSEAEVVLTWTLLNISVGPGDFLRTFQLGSLPS